MDTTTNETTAFGRMKVDIERHNEHLRDEALASRIVTTAFARNMFGGDGDWRGKTQSFAELIEKEFLDFRVRDDKNGRSVLQGELDGTHRTKVMVRRNHLMIFDYDNGVDFDELVGWLKEHGLMGIVHTSFNHLKAETKVNRGTLFKFLGRSLEEEYTPSNDDLSRFRRDHLKVVPACLEGTTFGGWIEKPAQKPDKRSPKGKPAKPQHEVLIRHSPLPKMRLVLILSEPYEFGEPETKERQAKIDRWSDVYMSVSEKNGIYCDPVCHDASRLFFLPSCRPEAAGHRIAVVYGAPFDLSSVAVKARVATAPGGAGVARTSRRIGRATEQQLPGLDGFMRLYGQRLDVEAIADHFGAEPPEARSSGHGVECECPLADDHASGTGGGFFGQNGSRPDGRGGTSKWPILHCDHATHFDLTTEDFVEAFVLGVSPDVDGEKIDITHAAHLWRYVKDKQSGEWCKVLEPFATEDEARAKCLEGKPGSKEPDKRSASDRLTLARRVGVTFGPGALATALLPLLKSSELLLPALNAAMKEGDEVRQAEAKQRRVREQQAQAEATRQSANVESPPVATVAEISEAVATLTDDSTDDQIKSVLLRLHRSDLDDAHKRKEIRNIRRRTMNEDRNTKRHMWDLWDSVTWEADWKLPDTEDVNEINDYMSRRYARAMWGKDFVYVDRSRKQIVGHYYKSLFESYRNTRYASVDEKGKDCLKSNWFGWWAEHGSGERFDDVVFKVRGHVGDHQLNLYQPDDVRPIRGDWSRLRRHIFENICDKNPYLFAYLICTLAQWVQAPDRKMGVAIVLISPQRGTGKSKAADWVSELFPNNSTLISSAKELFDQFNVQLATSIVVNVDDAGWAGDKTHEGQFRSMVTRERQSLQPKGIDRTEVDDFCRYIVTSNNKWTVPADYGERRWFVLNVNARRERDTKYFAAIDEQMEAGGLEAMKYDLMNLAIPEWIDLRNPPQTTGLREQANEGLPPERLWWEETLEDGCIRMAPDDGGDRETEEWKDSEELIIDCDDLRKAYRAFAVDRPGGRNKILTGRQFGKFLAEQCGIPGSELRKRCSFGSRPWLYHLPPLARLRELYAKETGVTFDDIPHDRSDERLTGMSDRLRRGLGFGAGVIVPDTVPMHALGGWGCWGMGIIPLYPLEEAA